MGYLTSTKCNPMLLDVTVLMVRIFIGLAMISHGFPKLELLLSGEKIEFFDFFRLGPRNTLILTVFAEFVCSFFVILGLFFRPAVFFLVFTMIIAALVVHGSDGFDKREPSLLYLSVYLLLFATGPGRFSVDGMISRKREVKW